MTRVSVAAEQAVVARGGWAGRPARPRDAWRWLAGLVSVVAGPLLVARYLVTDSFYDLYTGRYIVAHGLPYRNVATVASAGARWVDQQWLAHVLYYEAWVVGGYRAVVLLSALLVTAGFAMLGVVMLRRGVPPVLMFLWTFTAYVVGFGNFAVRAQSFAFPCLVLTGWLLLEDADAARVRRRTWLVLPTLVIWANTHGSVVMGAALAVGYAAYRVTRAWLRRDSGAIPGYLALGAAGGASVVCTPYGTGVLWYYGRFVGNPELTGNISEWQRPSLSSPFCWAFFALVLVLAVSLAVAWRRGVRPDPLIAAAALLTLAMAAMAIRNQAWFGLAGSLLGADTLSRSASGGPQVRAIVRRAVLGLLGCLAVASLTLLAVTPASTFDSKTPVRAIDEAAAIAAHHPQLRILGGNGVGTVMLWLHPAMLGRVGYDARFEAYSQSELSAYVDFLLHGPRWQRVTRGYGIIVVSSISDPALVKTLRSLPGWRTVYHDDKGIVLVRQLRPQCADYASCGFPAGSRSMPSALIIISVRRFPPRHTARACPAVASRCQRRSASPA